MNKVLNKVLAIFLLLNPLLDVSSFFGLPISILFRSLFLLIVIFYLIVRKKELVALCILFLFSLIQIGYQIAFLNDSLLFTISTILKFLYLPVTLLFFKNFDFSYNKDNLCLIILILYLGIYLFSYFFKIGVNNYLPTEGKKGFRGVFSSINEFSAIVTCLLPIVVNSLKEKRHLVLCIILLVCSLLCSFFTGTKILTAGVVFATFYLLWQYRMMFFRLPKVKKIGLTCALLFLIVFGGFFFTKTRTYQNMLVQQNFFKVKQIVSLEFVNKVLFNNRFQFLQDNYSYFHKQTILKKIFGIGLQDNQVKLVEIDFCDILFRYGCLGLIVFSSFLFITMKKEKVSSVDRIVQFLFLFISVTSGHALLAPAVVIYFSLSFCKS